VSYLARIRALQAHDPTRFRPWLVDGRRHGWIGRDVAAVLAETDGFAVTEKDVRLSASVHGFDARTACVGAAVERLRGAGLVGSPRDELYGVPPDWDEPPSLAVDRCAIAAFGVRACGVHVNGWTRRHGVLHLWVGTRASDRDVSPGKKDHLVAGGMPLGSGLLETLVKEAREEAGVPEALARTAVPVGVVTYRCEREGGLRDDTLYCFDLEVPEDFEPKNEDGEVASFERWPIDRVLTVIRDGDEFKYNVAPVVLDFAVRHGVLGPDEPGYREIVRGLRG
jgi:hypothetical protein